MKKINNYLAFGLLFNGIFLLGNRLDIFPEFIKGVCAGVGISLIILGSYAQTHDISKLRNFKKNILNKLSAK